MWGRAPYGQVTRIHIMNKSAPSGQICAFVEMAPTAARPGDPWGGLASRFHRRSPGPDSSSLLRASVFLFELLARNEEAGMRWEEDGPYLFLKGKGVLHPGSSQRPYF